MYVDSSENLICTKRARHTNSHHGRVDDKDDGDRGDAETVLMEEKNLARFVSAWKPLLDFLLETQNNETLFDD